MHSPTSGREGGPLEGIVTLALDFGALLMEVGASARHVECVLEQVAKGLGAESTDLRVGYMSLAITTSVGSETITRIRKIGPLGVNQSFHQALDGLAEQIHRGTFSLTEARAAFDGAVSGCSRHSDFVVAVAVGVACTAFGGLLEVDAAALGPIFVAATLAQLLRRQLAVRRVNVFLSTALVAFAGSLLGGLGARWTGSHTVPRDMVVTVLLLVPGVPAFNAQFDILEGHPTLGSARAVWVAVTLVFMTLGVWIARSVLGVG